MSQEAPKDLGTSTQNNNEWPDSFALYNSQITDLLFTDIFLPPQPSESNSTTLQENAVPNSLFGNPFGKELTDLKKSRLQLLLRQIVFSLSQEVDQMLYPVHAIHRIRRRLQHRKASNGTPKNCVVSKESLCNTCEHIKEAAAEDEHNMDSVMKPDVDDDLSFFIEKDPTKVEEKLSKHADILSETLGSMEKKLEDLIDMVFTFCRTMTVSEKQHLQKLIQKLPSRNLNHIGEIIRYRKQPPCGKDQSDDVGDEINVDLEKQDGTTLWRLYYYVKAVENAKKLSAQPPAI